MSILCNPTLVVASVIIYRFTDSIKTLLEFFATHDSNRPSSRPCFPFCVIMLRIAKALAHRRCRTVEGEVVYSELIVIYLFLGGAASGAFLIMSVWSLWFHSHAQRLHDRRLRMAFRVMKNLVYAVSLLLLLIAIGCLFADLKVPSKALLLFTRPRPTPLAFGAFVLAAEAAAGFALMVANSLRPRQMSGRLKAILEIVCVIASLAAMTYTAVYLFNQKAVALWSSPWLIALFLCSSTSSGISVVLLCNWFVQGRTLLLRAARPLQKIHVAVLVLEAAALFLYAAAVLANPDAASSLALLREPALLQTGVVGAVGMGIAAPFVLETYALICKQWRAIPVSDVICLIGGFCLRWCLIMGGAH